MKEEIGKPEIVIPLPERISEIDESYSNRARKYTGSSCTGKWDPQDRQYPEPEPIDEWIWKLQQKKISNARSEDVLWIR